MVVDPSTTTRLYMHLIMMMIVMMMMMMIKMMIVLICLYLIRLTMSYVPLDVNVYNNQPEVRYAVDWVKSVNLINIVLAIDLSIYRSNYLSVYAFLSIYLSIHLVQQIQ